MKFVAGNVARTERRSIGWATALYFAVWTVMFLSGQVHGQTPQPLVAIHDSELTRALDSSNSPAVFPTPTNAGTTGLQWWINDWHYFVMPEAAREAMRS